MLNDKNKNKFDLQNQSSLENKDKKNQSKFLDIDGALNVLIDASKETINIKKEDLEGNSKIGNFIRNLNEEETNGVVNRISSVFKEYNIPNIA